MSVTERLQNIKSRIEKACERSGRSPLDVRLLAVSKHQPLEKIEAARQCGQLDFAENYVQEALLKQEQLKARWHFIGRIQSNKVKFLAGHFAVIHSIDRFSVAYNLDKFTDGKAQDIFIQYNVAEEATKAGAGELELENLVHGVIGCKNLRVLGLMVMPPPVKEPEEARRYFRQARETLRRLRGEQSPETLALHPFDQLSMGTSQDFEIAIEEGASWVRVGTELFGPRATGAETEEWQ
jgi:pyridoxal phosphate enzyme (YggS family)